MSKNIKDTQTKGVKYVNNFPFCDQNLNPITKQWAGNRVLVVNTDWRLQSRRYSAVDTKLHIETVELHQILDLL